MDLLFSPSTHESGGSGFYSLDDSNAPNDSFLVSDEDMAEAVNLPYGAKYTFSPPVAPAVYGKMIVVPPSDAFLIDQAKASQISEIERAYLEEVNAPIAYLGTKFQADQESQMLVSGVLIASGGQLSEDFFWYDINNNPVAMTYPQLQGLARAILNRGQPLFTKKQDKKAAIRAANTVEAVKAITWESE